MRSARQAARFLDGLLHEPAWLAEVGVEVMEEGTARVVILLNYSNDIIRRCLPTEVNGIEVAVLEAG